MWLEKIKQFLNKDKEMKKAKEEKVIEVEQEVKQVDPTVKLELNNRAYGLVVSKGEYKIIEVPFDSEGLQTGEAKVIQTSFSRDEAQERFRILIGRNVFSQGLRG